MSDQPVKEETEFDFDFDPESLLQDHEMDVLDQQQPVSAIPGRAAQSQQPASPFSVVEEPNIAEPTPPKKGGNSGIIIAGVTLMLGLVGGLGFVAFQMLQGPSTPQAGASAPPYPQQSLGASESNFQNGISSGFGAAPESGSQAQGSSEWGAGLDQMQASTVSQGESQNWSEPPSSDVAPQVIPASFNDDSIVITHGQIDDTPAPSITEEERLYDDLLEKASALEVLPEAIVIDQNVVRREVEGRRVQELETQIKDTRQSIGALSTAVSGMQNQVGELLQAVESSAASQQALVANVDSLTAAVDTLNKTREADVKSLSDSIKKLSERTDEVQRGLTTIRNQAPAAAPAPRREVAAAPAPVKAQPVAPVAAPVAAPAVAKQPAPQPAATPVAQAQPAARPAVATTHQQQAQPVLASVNSAAQPAASQTAGGCAATAVSAIWRVKGVNSTSAYVARPQDRTGLFVREGLEVPGFGTVVSFDPVSRSVCTTSGLIQR